ncbi:ras GEF [Amylocystis lapponica]|nr:ras GEF [Amylocystis lapponica]
MSPSRLKIDTSVATIAGPSSGRAVSSNGSLTPASARASARRRSASASSSTSATTRALSSSPASARQGSQRGAPFAFGSDPASWSPNESISDANGRGTPEYVLAMHDFAPQHQNVTCLAFRAGQVIHVLNRDSSGWWDGELDGRRGWFPSNYVTSEVGLLTEEELPGITRPRPGHTHSMSAMSAASWASTPPMVDNSYFRKDHRPMAADGMSSAMDMYCPPLMVPLLHGLSLLQNAARSNRVAHFQPAAACIISCVRAVLTDVGCLARDAPILQNFGVLAQERKRILSDLASLVSQAKRASDDTTNEELRELEVEAMVRLGGQLFAHVRGLLAVAVQCGVSLPVQGSRPPGTGFGSVIDGRWDTPDGTLVRSDTSTPLPGEYGQYWEVPEQTTNAIERRPATRPKLNSPIFTRAKSLGDLRSAKAMIVELDVPAMPVGPHKTGSDQAWTPKKGKRFTSSTVGHKAGQHSVSSVSSSSSFSSGESVGTPATPVFPSGPSTTAEVMEALRYTHDHYLSTIAAFIGHAHSHSRTSHASSTGHMYDLVREVVDMVCKLLTIVEAVLKHSDIPSQKKGGLKAAKEGLYNVTSKLADSVRVLTMPQSPGVSEEEEKATLLRCATDALKAGSDCVSAVKKCLQRSTGERQFIVQLPSLGDFNSQYTPRKFSQSHRPSKSSSMQALRKLYTMNDVDEDANDEDLTIQAQTLSTIEDTPKSEKRTTDDSERSGITTLLEMESESAMETEVETEVPIESADPSLDKKPLPALRVSIDTANVPPDLPSPVSFAPTEDSGTTWEGGQRAESHSPRSLEEKLINGELPPVPNTPLADLAKPTLVPWTIAHDHAPDDVAYNSDGQLVGASLAALVERMTPHDSIVEPPFSAVFFLTFRLFTSPPELVEAVIARYNLTPPADVTDEDLYLWQQRKGLPVRLRVSNFVKTWLESYWRPANDNVVLPELLDFTQNALAKMFPTPSQRILELVNQWIVASESGVGLKVERVRDAGIPLNPPSAASSEVPRPIMTKTLLGLLRNKAFASISVTDFDTLELARQLTSMECTLYCAIMPEEVLETGQQGGTYPVNVKAVSSLSTAITGWVAESILNELDTKKRTQLVKFFIKLADRCASIRNFSTPRSILAALDSSTISRLQQTWMGLPQKNKIQLEVLRKLADHARNYYEYRTRLRNTAPPAVPFLGLYLTDVTFCREGNPSMRAAPKAPEKKLINFNKYHKLARIVQDMQRFQVPYNLKAIPEVQEYLKDAFEKSRHRGDLQDLYRRSLLVEPRQPADTPPASDVRQLFNWASRSQNQSTPTTAS